MSRPLVSICCITFQHAAFIRQTLEGFLMQRTDFLFEVIVHDDASKDGTAETIREFAARDPRIRAVLRETNIKSTGVPVFPITYAMAHGKYIALCEGDDYWTDPLKLQKQVDFLEAHPDHVLCFHQAMVLENGILVEDRITEPRYAKVRDRPIGVLDLLRVGNFIHTPTVLFRNSIGSFPEEFLYSPIGDFFIYVILLQQGRAHRIDEKMAVYRKGAGIFSSLTETGMLRSTLMMNSCILSYLSDPEQRQVLLQRHLEQLGQYEKSVRHSVLGPASIAGQLDIRSTFRILIRKLMGKSTPGKRANAESGS